MRLPKPIIQVKPGKLSPEDIAKIERGGYIVVECDPGSMQSMVGSSALLGPDDLLMSAMNAIEGKISRNADVANTFVLALEKRLRNNETEAKKAIEEARSR